MKKYIIIITTLLLGLQFTYGQKIDTSLNRSPQNIHDFYMQKRKTNLIVGWTMFGSGLAMIVGGAAINVSSPWEEAHKNDGLWLSYLGGAVTLTSIPIIISAGKNKRKARLALKRESTYNKMQKRSNYTALTVSMPL